MSRSTIAVYIPSYNQSEFLVQAIESILAQTRPPDQLLIIDDASSDDSPSVIHEYASKHPDLIEPVFHETNMGVGAVRAEAVDRSRCELTCYLDADDLFEPQKLELEEAALLDDPKAGYAYSNFRYLSADQEPMHTWYEEGMKLLSGNVFDSLATRSMPRGSCHRSELMRTDLIREAGSYTPGINLYEDFELKLRVARHHRAVAVNEVLHWYRMQPQGLHFASSVRHFKALDAIYNRNRELVDSLPENQRKGVNAGIQRLLSATAWNAIQQAAGGQVEMGVSDVVRYMKEGASQRPSTLLKPKNLTSTLSALKRALFV